MNVGGRVALCGAIAQYNATTAPAAPRNLAVAIGKQLTLEGFLVTGQRQHSAEFAQQMGAWLADGTIRHDETVVDGLEGVPQAFIDLLDGANTGKMLVRIWDRLPAAGQRLPLGNEFSTIREPGADGAIRTWPGDTTVTSISAPRR